MPHQSCAWFDTSVVAFSLMMSCIDLWLQVEYGDNLSQLRAFGQVMYHLHIEYSYLKISQGDASKLIWMMCWVLMECLILLPAEAEWCHEFLMAWRVCIRSPREMRVLVMKLDHLRRRYSWGGWSMSTADCRFNITPSLHYPHLIPADPRWGPVSRPVTEVLEHALKKLTHDRQLWIIQNIMQRTHFRIPTWCKMYLIGRKQAGFITADGMAATVSLQLYFVGLYLYMNCRMAMLVASYKFNYVLHNLCTNVLHNHWHVTWKWTFQVCSISEIELCKLWGCPTYLHMVYWFLYYFLDCQFCWNLLFPM